LAYDAVQAIADGVRSLGRLEADDLDSGLSTTRLRLRDAVAAADFEGLTGLIRFDARGDRPTGMAVMAVVPQAGGGYETRVESWVGGH
jgi:ABC-type branched-subunit amino acid transport system substrate-binding protein